MAVDVALHSIAVATGGSEAFGSLFVSSVTTSVAIRTLCRSRLDTRVWDWFKYVKVPSVLAAACSALVAIYCPNATSYWMFSFLMAANVAEAAILAFQFQEIFPASLMVSIALMTPTFEFGATGRRAFESAPLLFLCCGNRSIGFWLPVYFSVLGGWHLFSTYFSEVPQLWGGYQGGNMCLTLSCLIPCYVLTTQAHEREMKALLIRGSLLARYTLMSVSMNYTQGLQCLHPFTHIENSMTRNIAMAVASTCFLCGTIVASARENGGWASWKQPLRVWSA